MKKNGEYVGVDEKFIPEDEKYVDSTMADSIVDSAKKHKGLIKGIGIGYICFIIGVILFAVIMTIVMFNSMSSSRKSFNSMYNSVSDKINNEIISSEINNKIDNYSGIITGDDVISLLTEVNNINKQYPEHVITIIYEEKNLTTSLEILNLKRQIETTKKYDISFDYENKLITKVYIEKF